MYEDNRYSERWERFEDMGDLTLPRGSLRRFKEKFGERFLSADFVKKLQNPIIAVGDVTAWNVWDIYRKGFIPKPMLTIIDGATKRDEYQQFHDLVMESKVEYFQVQNPAGSITKVARDTIDYCLFDDNGKVILVDGEEDLLALWCIARCPINAYVLFGIPDTGVEAVAVTEDSRSYARMLLMSMRKSGMKEDEHSFTAVAGTFNMIHEGHKALLKQAFDLNRMVIVGITDDVFAMQSRSFVRPWIQRRDDMRKYLDSQGYKGRYEIGHVGTMSGGLEHSDDVRSLVVSEETCNNALWMNVDFKNPVEIVEIPMEVQADGVRFSSSRIMGYSKDTNPISEDKR